MLKSMGCETRVGNACQKREKNGLICGVTVLVTYSPLALCTTELNIILLSIWFRRWRGDDFV